MWEKKLQDTLLWLENFYKKIAIEYKMLYNNLKEVSLC